MEVNGKGQGASAHCVPWPLSKRGGKHFYNRWKAVCREADIEYTAPHACGRHTFATHALQNGETVHDVAFAGGWKSTRMVLERYGHAVKSKNTLANGLLDRLSNE